MHAQAATVALLLAVGRQATCHTVPRPDQLPSTQLPFWSATPPRPNSGQLGGITPLAQAKHVVVHRSTPAHGTYNHGAEIFVHPSGSVIVGWKNGAVDEDAPGQRIMAAWSTDGGRSFSQPLTVFSNLSAVTGFYLPGKVLNGGAMQTNGGRMYVMASVCNNTLSNTSSTKWVGSAASSSHHEYKVNASLARQVTLSAKGVPSFGTVYWDSNATPPGFESTGIPCRKQMPRQMAHDLSAISARSITDDPFQTAVSSSDRARYFLTEHTSWTTLNKQEDILLMRNNWPGFSNGSLLGKMWYYYASVRSGSGSGSGWSVPKRTNIPDSQANMASGSFVRRDGSRPVFLVNNAVPRPCTARHHPVIIGCDRDPLVISVAEDGRNFSRAWALIGGRPPMRFPGMCKNPGFMYPQAQVANGSLWVAYSINKEDIGLTVVPLSALKTDDHGQMRDMSRLKNDAAATMLRASLRLRRSPQQPDSTAINVRDYGANGTGKCEYGKGLEMVNQPYGKCTGESDDRAAIQTAVDAALAQHRPLFFPAGVYMVSAPIVVNTSDIVIYGNFWLDTVLAAGPGCHGAEAVLLFPTLTFPHSFSLIEVRGLSVNANSLASNAIQALSITRSRFNSIGVFRASNAGLRLASGWELHVEDSIIGCAGGGNGVGLLATAAINGLSVLTSTFEGE